MSRAAGVREADIKRAVRALEAAGLTVARVEIRAGGEVNVIPGPAKGAASALTTPAAEATPDDLASFRERKIARRAAQGS